MACFHKKLLELNVNMKQNSLSLCPYPEAFQCHSPWCPADLRSAWGCSCVADSTRSWCSLAGTRNWSSVRGRYPPLCSSQIRWAAWSAWNSTCAGMSGNVSSEHKTKKAQFMMLLLSVPSEPYVLVYSVQIVYLSSMIDETNQGPESRLTVWSVCDKAGKEAVKSNTATEKNITLKGWKCLLWGERCWMVLTLSQ